MQTNYKNNKKKIEQHTTKKANQIIQKQIVITCQLKMPKSFTHIATL
jgi:hypothetical protein